MGWRDRSLSYVLCDQKEIVQISTRNCMVEDAARLWIGVGIISRGLR